MTIDELAPISKPSLEKPRAGPLWILKDKILHQKNYLLTGKTVVRMKLAYEFLSLTRFLYPKIATGLESKKNCLAVSLSGWMYWFSCFDFWHA